MKNKFLLSLALLAALVAAPRANSAQIPYSPEEDARFTAVEARATALESPTSQTYANQFARVARFVYDATTTGYGSSVTDSGIHSMGVTLPAHAIITRSYLYVVTQLTGNAGTTIAFSCEDANNIKTATNLLGFGAGTFAEGQSTGASGVMVTNIAADCDIKATIATGSLTAGRIIGYVHYLLAE